MINMTKEEQLKQLKSIPGVGKSIAIDLWNIDIKIIMKKLKLPFLLILSILFLGHFSFAQFEKATNSADGKTDKKIVQEYEKWLSIKDDWPKLMALK